MTAEWRVKLETSLQKNKKLPYGKYYQLATLRPDGRPANRTVVHRGFYGANGITIVTDHRSDKILEVAKNPWGEAAWYFEDTREQYRIGGNITVVGFEHKDEALLKERQRTWNMLSPGGRGQFLYPDPGKPRSDGDEAEFEKEAPPPKSEPSENFCLLILDADEVDYLDLKANTRIEYKSSEVDNERLWAGVSVNP